jgi:allophanate hydrolase
VSSAFDPLPSPAVLRDQYLSGTTTVPEIAARVLERSSRAEYAQAWIHRVAPDELLADAYRLQALLDAVKGGDDPAHKLPPLFGIPFAVKDNIDVAGVTTTAACPGYAHVPAESAFAVRKLLEAGALFIGKTNLDQFATGLVGTRSPYGACPNPFNPDYITGGSSSGSALAVATGMVSFALGTDTAGSGRVPAAFCNLVGVKPTRGLVSTRGVVPACPSLDCVTVFAHSAIEAYAVLRVMQGFDPQDPWSRKPASPNNPAASIFTPQTTFIPGSTSHATLNSSSLPRHFRFGVPLRGQLDFEGDGAYESLYHHAVERWSALGGTAVAVDIEPLLECARLLYTGPWLAERAEAIIGPGTFGADHAEDLLPLLRTILEPARTMTAINAFAGFRTLQALRRAAEPLWDCVDFLLLPTTPTIFTQAQITEEPLSRNAVLGRFTNFVNLMDLSAVALPAGFREDGLPFGITALAPAFCDDVLEQVAQVWSPGVVPATPLDSPEYGHAGRTSLLVFGLHMTGFPLNHELTNLGATFEATVSTSTRYRMALIKRGEKRLPGVWRQTGTTGVALEGELWSVPDESIGAFFTRVLPPLCLGSIELGDGRWVKGFLAEGAVCEAAEDISRYGGWKGWALES